MLGRVLSLLLALSTTAACASGTPRSSQPAGPRAEPIEFSYVAPDGVRFDSVVTRGRVTAILFLTTYDLNSQLVAKRLNEVLRSFKPRFNAGAVVLEPGKYAVFLEPFKSSLGLLYPVVLADQATLQGEGAIGSVEVPTLLILDVEGRPMWRLSGPATEQQIRNALKAAQSKQPLN
jgi:hypothetical protein